MPRAVTRDGPGQYWAQYGDRVELLEWIADERRSVADLVESLTPEQLATPSLCGAWTVHDVAAHLLMPLVTPLPKVLLAMLMSGFDFDRANVRLTAVVARRSPAQIAEELRRHAAARFKPPGMGFEAPLNDLLVHEQDIRRPLGLSSTPEPDRLHACLDFVGVRRLEGPRPSASLGGVRLEASDVGWSAGNGLLARGPGAAILMVLNRRPSALVDLEGPGAELLRERAR